MTTGKPNALIFIFITLLVDCIGIGIIIPVVPKLIQELISGSISEASIYGGWLAFSYSIMQFLMAPTLGGLSDKFGRRPILLLSLAGLGVDYLFLAVAPSIFWLFIGRIIAGIFGASFTTATAYIADISPPEKRAQNFGMVGAAFGLGFIIGPVIGGIFGEIGTRLPFIVAAGFSFLNLLYGYFVLPESLKPENKRPFSWKRSNPVGGLVQVKKYPNLMGLVIAVFLVNLAAQAPPSVWTYYTMFKFDWSEKMVGYSLGVVGLVIGIVQGGLIRKIIPWLGNNKSVYVGISITVVGYVLFAIAPNTLLMFLFIIPFGLGAIAGPALQGLVSNKVPDNEQGEIQGTITSLVSLASIIGPIVMTQTFFMFTNEHASLLFPGAPFILSSLFLIVSLVVCAKSLTKE